jgi:hypothetical protein
VAGRDVLGTREAVKAGIVDELVDPAERIDALINRESALLKVAMSAVSAIACPLRALIDCTIRAAASASTSLTITAAPASAAAIAYAAPRPRPAPVMTTTLPSRNVISASSWICVHY